MMDGNRETFALFGDPVEHSLSPLMHNTAFRSMNLNYRYIAIRATHVSDIFRIIKSMNVRGASITLPHKTAVMACLDDVSESAIKIGAVNTITLDRGHLRGDNTDWVGLAMALRQSMKVEKRSFAVLGAGGAARSAVYCIREAGGVPVLLNRTVEQGQRVARELGCDFLPLEEIGTLEADCLVNATPVGMWPHTSQSPVGEEVPARFRWVTDIIYNPLKTKLLEDAEKAGCNIIPGLFMFLHQGAEQIRLWTGQEPPVPLMEKVLREELHDEGN